jgi:putative ABC transport system permease protein
MSSTADCVALREGLVGVEGLAAYAAGEIPAALPDPRTIRAIFASANYFDVLGVRPAIGRAFTASDSEGNGPVALIAHHVWTRQFNSDPAVLGRTVRVGNAFVHVVGVAPQFFGGVDRPRPGARAPELWLPMWLADRVLPLTFAEQRRQERDIYFVGRLKDDVDVLNVQMEADVVARRLANLRTQSSPGALAEVRRVWRVDPKSWHFGIIVVMPIPILVLACVNAANLMLARGSQQQREIAIRLSIGAARGRVIRQLFFESAALAAVSTVVAVAVASWGLQFVSRALDTPVPLDTTVLTLTIVTALATTVAFGLMPAIRLSAQQPLTTLGLGGGDATPRQSHMRSVLVAAQVALSIGLLATAWQLVATIRVFGQSMRLAGIGLIVGTAASVGVSRWIQSEYHGITGIDPLAVAASVGLSLVAMLLGSGIPAARASHLDPVQQLKDQ